jgi:hypothetical protein
MACLGDKHRRFGETCCLTLRGRTINRKEQKSVIRDINNDDSGLKLTNVNGQYVLTFSETSALIYKITRRQIPEHSNLHSHLLQNSKSDTRKLKAEPSIHVSAALTLTKIPA